MRSLLREEDRAHLYQSSDSFYNTALPNDVQWLYVWLATPCLCISTSDKRTSKDSETELRNSNQT